MASKPSNKVSIAVDKINFALLVSSYNVNTLKINLQLLSNECSITENSILIR